MKKAKILYVEDDETLAFVTRDNLEFHGYEVLHASNGTLALETFRQQDVDILILDIMLPDIDGFSIAQNIRKYDSDTPILFLSAKTLLEDRIKGLEIGADDYLMKPFSVKELILKIEIFLKRSQSAPLPAENFRIGGIDFSPSKQKLSIEQEDYKLTQRESELLKYLVLHQNKICKREDILKSIWGEDDYFLGRSLDVFISRLRKYLKSEPTIQIDNVHGVGFIFKVDTDTN